MGRPKARVAKIENKSSRQVTFSKRRAGLFRKAHELSVLCNVDVALIAFSGGGRLYNFSGSKRIEDVLIRCLNCPNQEDVVASIATADKERLLVLLESLKAQEDVIAGASSPQGPQPINDQTGSKAVEDVDQELVKCQERLENLKGYLRFLHSDEPAITSESEFDERDRKLMGFLTKVKERKSSLLNMLTPLSGPITQMQLEEQQNVLMPENCGLVQTQPHEDLTLSAWQMQLQEQQNSLLPENSGLVQAQPHEDLTWNGFQMRLQEQQSNILVENSGLAQAEPHEESTWNDLRVQSQVQNNLVVEGSGLAQTQPHEEGTFLPAAPGTVSLDSINCEMPMPSEIDRIFDLWDAAIDPSLVQELLDCFSN